LISLVSKIVGYSRTIVQMPPNAAYLFSDTGTYVWLYLKSTILRNTKYVPIHSNSVRSINTFIVSICKDETVVSADLVGNLTQTSAFSVVVFG